MATKRAPLTPGHLEDMVARKPATKASKRQPEPPPPEPPSEAIDNRRAWTMRLNEAAWRQLRILAMDERTSAHALMLEAIDDLFAKRNLPRVAKDT